MNIVPLRKKMNSLIERKNICAQSIATINSLKCVFTDVMAKNQNQDDDDNSEGPDVSHKIGRNVWIFDENVLFSLIEPLMAQNLLFHFKEIGRLAVTKHHIDLNETEPSRDGWSPDEYTHIVHLYHHRISTMQHALDEINNEYKALMKMQHYLPRWSETIIKNNPNSEYEYTANDFRRNQSISWTESHENKPKIMSARWMAPFYGDKIAKDFEDALKNIKSAITERKTK